MTIEISEFSHHIFSQFVRWVYGGKKEIALEDASELIRCAAFYQAPELVTICQRLIEEAAAERSRALHMLQQQQQMAAQQQAMELQQQQQQQHHYDHDPVITGMPLNGNSEAMMELFESPLLADHDNYVSADTNVADLEFGMNMWSNDPVLYPSESTDAFRIMEIC